MGIKLVISDVDGTLLTSAGTVSVANRQEIARIIAAGVHFSVASGRPSSQIRPKLADIEATTAIISSNGAVVEDLVTGEILLDSHLERSLARQVCMVTSDFDISHMLLDTAHGWSCRAGTGRRADETEELIRRLGATRIEDWSSYFASEPQIRKLIVYGKEPELGRLESALGPTKGIQVTSSWLGNREIIVAGMDKAAAARRLTEHLGFDPSEVLAVGDNRNDIELIGWAGIGVAMENAIPELKQIADWITTTNDDDGIAHALAHFVR
jgi:Cof subfamily protein (haloacid dehalogenase superfamily)